jgi:hypothetical protein
MFTIMHRIGNHERSDDLRVLDSLLDELEEELDWADDEHPDVAVGHESGWTLSVFRGGRVFLEDVECETAETARHADLADRESVLEVCRLVATGRFEALERFDWVDGYGT